MTPLETANITTQLSLQSDMISKYGQIDYNNKNTLREISSLLQHAYEPDDSKNRPDKERTYIVSKEKFERVFKLMNEICSPPSTSINADYLDTIEYNRKIISQLKAI